MYICTYILYKAALYLLSNLCMTKLKYIKNIHISKKKFNYYC